MRKGDVHYGALGILKNMSVDNPDITFCIIYANEYAAKLPEIICVTGVGVTDEICSDLENVFEDEVCAYYREYDEDVYESERLWDGCSFIGENTMIESGYPEPGDTMLQLHNGIIAEEVMYESAMGN